MSERPPQRILVTGGTGFVGRALVRRIADKLLDARDLRLLVRDPGRAEGLGVPRENLIVGDLDAVDAIERAATGVDAVVHIAGALTALRAGDLRTVNHLGTENVARAAAACAPGCRFVQVSSLAAAGPSVDGSASARPAAECRPPSAYGESKRLGELAVARHGASFSWIALRPPIVYGPGDAATRLLFRQALAPLAVVPWRPRPVSLIHVDDLIEALWLALGSSAEQCAFGVEGPERLDTDALITEIARACGRRARRLRFPLALAQPVAALADVWCRLRGRPSFFNSDKIREVRQCGWVVDPQPAKDLLGFEPKIAIAEGFRNVAEAEGFV